MGGEKYFVTYSGELVYTDVGFVNWDLTSIFADKNYCKINQTNKTFFRISMQSVFISTDFRKIQGFLAENVNIF